MDLKDVASQHKMAGLDSSMGALSHLVKSPPSVQQLEEVKDLVRLQPTESELALKKAQL